LLNRCDSIREIDVSMKSRYLKNDNLIGLLHNSKSIEQLLAPRIEGDIGAVRFVRIEKGRSGEFLTAFLEVSDDGSPDFLDVYEFAAIDPDLPYGEIKSFISADEAIDYACQILGADEGKFVGAGMIQDEYRDVLHPDW
jgi:hypothetical protein